MHRVPLAFLTGVLAVLMAVSSTGCSAPARAPKTKVKTFDLEADKAQLVIPPTAATGDALARIEIAARAGDARAAWVDAHYLLDLFDDARYGNDATARKQLFATLGIPDGTGPAVTDRVIDALLTRVDRVLTADRLHGGAQAARTLLEQDRAPAKMRSELFARMSQLKGIARGTGPLAANADLRLAGFCARAFSDAVAAAPGLRPGILSYCLYPLYDSDPEPYFAADPAARPPEPRWQDLSVDLVKLLRQIGKTKSRLAPLGPASAGAEVSSLDEAKGALPSLPDPKELGVPAVGNAEPYQWTPILALGDGSKIAAPADLAKSVVARVAQDGRARLAVLLQEGAPATVALVAATAAAAAFAHSLELIVSYDQQLKVPPGDYWSGRLAGDKITRLGVVPLAIAGTSRAIERSDAHAGGWDPARATLGLHLVLTDQTWRLVGDAGALDPVKAGDVVALAAQLTTVLSAYEGEDGLVLVPQAGATYAQLVAAAIAAHGDATHRLFGDLALSDAVPAAPKGGGTLAATIARRAGARVTIAPDTLAPHTSGVRACYQDLLEKHAKLGGSFTLVWNGDAVTITEGPKDAALRKCVTDSLAAPIKAAKIANTKVTLETH